MTRHSWPACAWAEPAVAPGAEPVPMSTVTAAALPAARTAASRRDVRKLRRMAVPFLAQVSGALSGLGESVNGSGTCLPRRHSESQPLTEDLPGNDRADFRNVPEHASMVCMTETARTNGPARVTIREVAEAAGVSIATVSRVLNGR